MTENIPETYFAISRTLLKDIKNHLKLLIIDHTAEIAILEIQCQPHKPQSEIKTHRLNSEILQMKIDAELRLTTGLNNLKLLN